jgi:hypothetical protein
MARRLRARAEEMRELVMPRDITKMPAILDVPSRTIQLTAALALTEQANVYEDMAK